MQPLFFEPSVVFEKVAAQTQLPEDPNSWAHELLQELYKQAPYVSDFAPHVVMDKVDGEQGYGLGYVEIGNQTEIQTATSPSAQQAAGIRKVRVPVVIKDGMLSPLDLLVTDDSKVLPLTEPRLRAAIFRPQAFDVTSRTPGDMSMIGQLYPPYRQSMGFGGGGTSMNVGMGKEGSALEQFLLQDTGTEKTASFQSETEHFRDASYLHAPEGTKQGRHGKKMASFDAKPGAIDDFIATNKTASAEKENHTARDRRKSNTALAATAGAIGGIAAGGNWKERVAGGLAGAAGGGLTMHALQKLTDGQIEKLKKTGSVLEAIRSTIYESDLDAFKQAIVDPGLRPLLHKNASAITPSIQLLVETPERPKFAEHFGALVRPTVYQLRRMDEGYRVKSASRHFWDPKVENIDRVEALRRYGEKVVLAADLSGTATVAEGEGVGDIAAPEHDSDMVGAKPVTEAGLYKVQTPEGEEAVGYVIPNLIDIDGTKLPLALFTNGTQASVQGDIVGSPVEGAGVDLPSADVPSGKGVFASEESGTVEATVPLTINASVAGMEGEPDSYRAESFTGEQVIISRQPNLQTVVGTEDGKLLIPESWQWIPLTQADEIALESQEDGLGKQASLRRQYATVELVSGGGATFSVRGPLVEKLAHDEREMLGLDDMMFLLAGLGVNQDYGTQKLSMAMTGAAPVRVRVGHSLKMAGDEAAAARARAEAKLAHFPQLKQRLFKEAAALGDPSSVDTVLSLGFINPDNLMTFVGYLPVLEDSQSRLCDILLASRMGNLIDTPDGSVERAVRSLEAVLEGLKALAFQNN